MKPKVYAHSLNCILSNNYCLDHKRSYVNFIFSAMFSVLCIRLGLGLLELFLSDGGFDKGAIGLCPLTA